MCCTLHTPQNATCGAGRRWQGIVAEGGGVVGIAAQRGRGGVLASGHHGVNRGAVCGCIRQRRDTL